MLLARFEKSQLCVRRRETGRVQVINELPCSYPDMFDRVLSPDILRESKYVPNDVVERLRPYFVVGDNVHQIISGIREFDQGYDDLPDELLDELIDELSRYESRR